LNLSIINFSNSLPSEVKKLTSVFQPELIYIGKDDYELQEFCYTQGFSLINVGSKKVLAYCKCEEIIKSGDLTIIVCGDSKQDNLFEHSLEYCRKNRKDFMVVFDDE